MQARTRSRPACSLPMTVVSWPPADGDDATRSLRAVQERHEVAAGPRGRDHRDQGGAGRPCPEGLADLAGSQVDGEPHGLHPGHAQGQQPFAVQPAGARDVHAGGVDGDGEPAPPAASRMTSVPGDEVAVAPNALDDGGPTAVRRPLHDAELPLRGPQLRGGPGVRATPVAASSATTRAPYQASSAGPSDTIATTRPSPSQAASQTLSPSGDTRRTSPVAGSRVHADRHSSSPADVSTSGTHAGRSAAAASCPTVPDPRPSACSACSPAMTSRIRRPSGDQRWCSAIPGGHASRRGSPSGPSSDRRPRPRARGGAGRGGRRGSSAIGRRATSGDPRRRRRPS